MKYLKFFESIREHEAEEIENIFLLTMLDNGYEVLKIKRVNNGPTYIISYPKNLHTCIYGGGFIEVENEDGYYKDSIKSIVISMWGKKDNDFILREIPRIRRRLPKDIDLYGVTSFDTVSGVRYDFAFTDKNIEIEYK